MNKNGRGKTNPPKEIQHLLMAHGCRITEKDRKELPDGEALYEEYIRYKPWCNTMIRTMKKGDAAQRTAKRKAKRVFEASHSRSKENMPTNTEPTDEEKPNQVDPPVVFEGADS